MATAALELSIDIYLFLSAIIQFISKLKLYVLLACPAYFVVITDFKKTGVLIRVQRMTG